MPSSDPVCVGGRGYGWAAGAIVAIVIVVLALLLVVWYTIDVLVLIFTGIPLAVFLRGRSDILSRHTPLGGQSSLRVVVNMLLGIVGVGIWLLKLEVSSNDARGTAVDFLWRRDY